ncbi:MAG: hypothetical protein JWM11_13 [Planctomycetaceae bacterium]|nr:hypothetical protein [Planctomycetaceae bacterium]
MSVGWLLDASVFDVYHDELAAAVVRNGDQVKSLNRPNPPYGWDDTGSAYRKAFPVGSCVVTHADIDLVQRVLADGCWTPGAFATIDHFSCVHYFSHFGRFLLNQDYAMLPFAELSRCSEFLFDTFGRDGRMFVRPDSPLKLFAGLVVSRETFAKDLDFMAFYSFPPESLVVVSSPKTIVKEWRFVVAEQSIVASSQYKEGAESMARSGADDEAVGLANAILALGYSPDPVWVMDICETSDGRYHLLEIGGFSFANLYGCDKDAVVKAVSRMAQRVHKENCVDRRGMT